jgi:hypothetical protein
VQVVVPVTTLLGLSEEPAELAGYGPIPAGIARQIAADATWRRLLTDPASGALLDYGRTTYRPPAHLAGHVRARHQVCVFPGCRRPACKCDLDHRVRFPDGPTSEANLGPACRRHHRCKQRPGWSLHRDEHGNHHWTTPTGRTYINQPDPLIDPVIDPGPPAPAAAAPPPQPPAEPARPARPALDPDPPPF